MLFRSQLAASAGAKEIVGMTKQELVARMQDGRAWIPGRRVKIDFGGDQGAVMLDGAAQRVTEEDGPADTTIKVGWDDWQQLASGQMDGMTAFMMGKIRVEGDMSNAMQLQGVLAKLKG
jgi:putative sterol carrier protein